MNISIFSLGVLHITALHFSEQSVYLAMSAPHQSMGQSSVYTLHTAHCTLQTVHCQLLTKYILKAARVIL